MHSLTKNLLTLLVVTTLAIGCSFTDPKENKTLSVAERRTLERSNNNDIEKKIDELLSQMTMEEKIGQMTQLNNSTIVTESNWGAGSDLSITTDS